MMGIKLQDRGRKRYSEMVQKCIRINCTSNMMEFENKKTRNCTNIKEGIPTKKSSDDIRRIEGTK